MPAGLSLDEAADLLSWGSLAAALVLFLPSTLLLGCIPPLATEIVQRRQQRSAGDAGGRVLAVSTLGSIAGTFSTTYVSLPQLGLTRTFLVAGALLVILGLSLSLSARHSSFRVPGFLSLGLAAALVWSRLRSPVIPDGFRLLESRESAYQSVRVVEGEGEGHRMRRLQVNEGFDSFQSVWQPQPGFLPTGYYYNLFALPPQWSSARGSGSWRLLVLGLGGGTTWRVIDGTLPDARELEAIGVEIDPVVTELGYRWLDLPRGARGHTVLSGWDARAALHSIPGSFDQVVLDAYANQMEIPAHLSTQEFFETVRDRLSDGGWLCVNVGAFGLSDPVVDAVARTIAHAFDRRVLALRVPFSRNCVLFARRDSEAPVPSSSNWKTGVAVTDRLLAALALEGTWKWFGPTADRVLTDDLNEIESLQRRSIDEARTRWVGVP